MPIIPITSQTKRSGARGVILPGTMASAGKDPIAGLEPAGCYSTPLFQDAQHPDLRIGLGNYFVHKDPGGHGGDPALWLQFVLKGNLHFRLDGITREGVMEEGQYNLFTLPAARKINYFDLRNSHTQTLDIHFSPGALLQPAGEFPALAGLLEMREKGLMDMLSPCPGVVNPPILRIMLDILHCDFEGELRRIYMETKAMELLLLSLERVSHGPEDKDRTIHLKKSDIECIRESREWLMRQMDNPPTLKELAHHAGINDFKLKKGYKQVFGTTVFGDFHRERMERARKYLMETGMALIEVALLSGYADTSNFSRAFKAYFGFTAGELRKHA